MDRSQLIPASHIPRDMASGPIRLQFEEMVSVAPGGELVPFYHFNVVAARDGSVVGHINFRVGDTRHIRMVAGHIGYEIQPYHRGRSYAYHACRALAPFVRQYYEQVVLTVDPSNRASTRIIEKLGADFVDEVTVPADDPAHSNGARRKRRYQWNP